MGTPAFAVASLEALLQAGCHIVAVVTAPDKPAGRGMQLQQSAVKQCALAHGLPVLQPEKLKDPLFLEALRSYRADLQVVVAFRMLPEVVWNMPPMGSLNLHGSWLPQYRGAAPINWAVINGETETGVTTFKLQHAIDTGDILLRERLPIGENETAGELHDRMMHAGARLLVQTVQGLAEGSLQPVPQSTAAAAETLRHAPKIFTDTCRIGAARTVTELHNLIRGLSPYPGAFTLLNGKTLKVFRSDKFPQAAAEEIETGTTVRFYSDQKTYLHLACADGRLALLELQLEGKKRMPVADFLRGYRLDPVS